ncbi:ATP-binding protein [Curvibacter sp. RS43]|uniref:sensor histidine kinase n=1 Tax=Curvibacter microcysteis TaxID=3026419 RepID=UPI0023629E39|nr:ATP-binding protein [Curvibacter sp. RS43]MDD0812071.1 ATP-binding protein [Curvibacter sp. RS43]
MHPSDTPSPSWFSPLVLDDPELFSDLRTPSRLWHGFLTARLMLALAILALQLLGTLLSQPLNIGLLLLGLAYLGATLSSRLLASDRPPTPVLGPHWLPTIGMDLLVFSLLQWWQPGNVNYTPLLGMPVLMAAALGSRLLTLSSAAAGTLMLLAQAGLQQHLPGTDVAALFLQAGLTGSGYFVIGLLVFQLAQRLAREERLSHRNRMAAKVQAQVNALVIDNLHDGLLVVDARETVRALNPAARALLGPQASDLATGFWLGRHADWQALLDLARRTFLEQQALVQDVSLKRPEPGTAQVHVRTRLTASSDPLAGNLCVMFLQDLRELEARLRTEKLAAMGRMSAAMAHEIRNPLAAIAQANALLEEDVQDPAQRRLVLMVQQNAQRLTRIVEDILDIARVQHQQPQAMSSAVSLDEQVALSCHDWQRQAPTQRAFKLDLQATGAWVVFDNDHLRRVLVNLLDNALRYQGPHSDSLQISTRCVPGEGASLQVWSDGPTMEASVERHLFEPFFSSESRSTGLGLYICRQLCERHGAQIHFQRVDQDTARGAQPGNAFVLRLNLQSAPDAPSQLSFDTMAR